MEGKYTIICRVFEVLPCMYKKLYIKSPPLPRTEPEFLNF